MERKSKNYFIIRGRHYEINLQDNNDFTIDRVEKTGKVEEYRGSYPQCLARRDFMLFEDIKKG